MNDPAMTPGQTIRFAFRYARRDLFEPAARPVTRAIVAAVALTAAGSAIALALPGLTVQVKLSRLKANPLARCLWVSGFGYENGGKIDDARRRRLTDAIAGRLARPGRPEVAITVSGYHETTYELPDLPVTGLAIPKGRTVRPEDPLCDALPALTRKKTGFPPAGEAAVIVSPKLLARLGLPPDAPPDKLWFRAPASGRRVSLPVSDVTREPLPLGYLYLLTPSAHDLLRGADPDESFDLVRSGPLGPGWPTRRADYPQKVRDLADGQGVSFYPEDQDNGWVLKLVAVKKYSVSEWRANFLEKFHSLMTREMFAAHDPFMVPEPPKDVPRPELPPPGPDDRVTVYVSDLSGLRPTAEAVEETGLYVNDSAIAQLEEIEATAQRDRLVLYGLVGVFCLGGLVGLGTMLYLRAKQKAAQIGMLRAMGAGDGVIDRVAAATAVLLWARGTGRGLVVGGVLGSAGALAAGVTLAELAAALLSWEWVASVGGYLMVSLLGSVASGWLAIRPLRKASPAETLGLA